MPLTPGQSELWDSFLEHEYPKEKGVRVPIPEGIEPYDEAITFSDVIIWTNSTPLDDAQKQLADEVIHDILSQEGVSDHDIVSALARDFDEDKNEWYITLRSGGDRDGYGA